MFHLGRSAVHARVRELLNNELYDKPRKNIEYSGLDRQELAGVAAKNMS